jgi:hypothetical protein
MAAIIEFPTAASIWRRRTAASNEFDHRGGAKIIVFSGVRYSRPEEPVRAIAVAPACKKGVDA